MTYFKPVKPFNPYIGANFYFSDGTLIGEWGTESEEYTSFEDFEWETTLEFIMYGDIDIAASILKYEPWVKWATAPERIKDPKRDDPVPGIGLSRLWLALKSRFRWPGYWHDLMYRGETAVHYSRKAIDDRFLLLMLHPIFSHDKWDVCVAHMEYRATRMFGGIKYEGPQ